MNPSVLQQPRRLLTPVLSLAVAASLALAVPGPATSAQAEPVDGAQTSGDVLFPNVGNGGYDAQHYDVDLAWTPAAVIAQSTIEATTTMTATTTGAPLRTFSLDLEGLTVDAVTVDGVPATWTRVEDAEAIKHKLVITPATPVEGEFTTAVTYSGVPTAHRDADGSLEGWNATTDGATFLNQPIGSMTGFPNNNTPSDKATYTLDLDIPTTLGALPPGTPVPDPSATQAAAVSNGVLAARTPSADGSRTTWSWVQERPMASELALISIGRYEMLTSQIRLAGGRVLPEWTFIDPLVTPADRAETLASRRQQKAIIDGLETRYGPYPGVATGLVVDIVPDDISYALETQDRSFFPSSASLSTTVHEITHQWWGDAVAPRVWNDIWINEGMATWAEVHYAEAIAETSETTTEDAFYEAWASEPADSDNWDVAPGAMTDPADLYGFWTYSRSAMMWEALRLSIGDRAFFAFLREWQDTFTGTSRGSAEFIALAEEVAGRDLTAFFDDWVYDADKPAWPATYAVSLAASPGGRLAPGDRVTYTLTARSTGDVAVRGAQVSVDLADVLDDATLGRAGLPEGLTLRGRTLAWRVPTTPADATATVAFAARVARDATGGRLAATATAPGLGATCRACATSQAVRLGLQTLRPTPRIEGRPVVGTRLRARPGRHDAGTSLSYRWRTGGRIVAFGPRMAVRGRYVGQRIRLTVVSTKPGFRRQSSTSRPTNPVRRR